MTETGTGTGTGTARHTNGTGGTGDEDKPDARTNARPKGGGVILALYAVVILLFGAADAVEYLTRTKMGMARHMVYLRGKWSAALPVETLAAVGAAVAVLACAVVVALWVRSGKLKSVSNVAAVVAAASLTALFTYHTFGTSLQDDRSYILVVPLLGLAALVQCANAALVVRRESETR